MAKQTNPRDGGRVYGFDRRSAERTSTAVRAVEASNLIGAPRGSRSDTIVSPFAWGKVTEEIGEGSFDSPGVGKVQIYRDDDDGVSGPVGDPVACYNRVEDSDATPVDTGVLMIRVGRKWYVALAPCIVGGGA